MIAPAPDFEAAGYCRIADNLYSDTEAVAFSLPAIKGRAVQPDARPDAPPSQTQQHFMLIAALANLVQASAIVLYAAEDRDLVRSLSRLLKCKLFVVDDQQARIEAVFSPDMPDVKYIFSAAGNGFSLLDKQALLVDFSGTCSMAGQGFRHYLGYLAGTGLPASRSDHSGVFFSATVTASHYVLSRYPSASESPTKPWPDTDVATTRWLISSSAGISEIDRLQQISVNLQRVFRYLVATCQMAAEGELPELKKIPLLSGLEATGAQVAVRACSWHWIEGEMLDRILCRLSAGSEANEAFFGYVGQWYRAVSEAMAQSEPGIYLDAIWQNTVVCEQDIRFIDLEWLGPASLTAEQLLFRAVYRYSDAQLHRSAAEVPGRSIYRLYRALLEEVGASFSRQKMLRFLLEEARFTSVAQGRPYVNCLLLLGLNVFLPFRLKRRWFASHAT